MALRFLSAPGRSPPGSLSLFARAVFVSSISLVRHWGWATASKSRMMGGAKRNKMRHGARERDARRPARTRRGTTREAARTAGRDDGKMNKTTMNDTRNGTRNGTRRNGMDRRNGKQTRRRTRREARRRNETLSDEIHDTNTAHTGTLISNCCSHHGARKRAAPHAWNVARTSKGRAFLDPPPFAV